jgi:ATP-dependent Clp protease ATP-binding subunit ClpA
MYELFTDRARKVMRLANQEAQRFNHQCLDTEHILLGLIKEGEGVAANVLRNLDMDLRKIRLEVEKIEQSGLDMVTRGKLPLTARAVKVVEYSNEEARNLNHDYVGTEHLLLGLLREQEGVAAQILMSFGIKPEDVRAEVVNLLGTNSGPPSPVQHSPVEANDLPAEVKPAVAELDAQIERLNLDKEDAVAEQDFERAANLRDEADKLSRRRKAILREWAANHPVDASWLAWNGNMVARMARAISTERQWKDLPALAGALEAAGCTDAEVLSHCRQPGLHRGQCWVLDWLLGKL